MSTASSSSGGHERVPRVQEEIQKALGDKLDLGMHINSDESMALGAAFHGANVSTAFRVRHVGMADVNPFPVSISLNDLAVQEEEEEKKTSEAEADAESKEAEGEEEQKKEDDDEVWSKHAAIFKSFGRIGVKKSIAFTHDRDVECSADYEESEILPTGTETSIERYNVSGIAASAEGMEGRGLAKPKVSLQFELSSSGITRLVKAEAVVEEEIVTVTEEVEVDEDDEEGGGDNVTKEEEADDGEAAKEGEEKKEEAAAEEEKKAEGDEKKDDDEEKKEDAEAKEGEEKKENETEAAKEPEKKKKTKTIEKEKKKVHRRALKVTSYHVGRIQPYSPAILEESSHKLQALAEADKERMLLEESKNKVESYIYHIKNTLVDDEDNINKVTNEEQRDAVRKLAEDAEEWMYDDGYNADLPTYEDKYAELSVPFEKIKFRVRETEDRPDAVRALTKKLGKIEKLMDEWKESMPQVTDEERETVLGQVASVREWIGINEEKQSAQSPWEDPVFVSADVPGQTREIEREVKKLSKKPKPAPPKEEEKDETEAGEAEGNETEKKEGEEAEAAAEGGEEKKEGEEAAEADAAAEAAEGETEKKEEDEGKGEEL